MAVPTYTTLVDMAARIQQLELSLHRYENLLATVFNVDVIQSFKTRAITGPPLQPQKAAQPERTFELSTVVTKPYFSGHSKFFSAPEFLLRYEQYLSLTMGSVSSDFKLCFVGECLQGTAKLWYRTFSFLTVDWASFKQIFLAHFWSNKAQSFFMQEICYGRYDPTTEQVRMSTYFLRFVNKARFLQQPPMEALLLKCLAMHFPLAIRARVMGAGTIWQAYENLLDEEHSKDHQIILNRITGVTGDTKRESMNAFFK